MCAILQAVAYWAEQQPRSIAISGRPSLNYRQLHNIVSQLGDYLARLDVTVIGLAMTNGSAWASTDLAAMSARITLVPLPGFFSDKQILHAIADAGIDCIISDEIEHIASLVPNSSIKHIEQIDIANTFCYIMLIDKLSTGLTDITDINDIAKITYTSGTTGQPKGVCLRQQALDEVTSSLLHATGMSCHDRYLCLMPLSTLLENVGGIYVPLLAGASSHLLPARELGTDGVSKLDAQAVLDTVRSAQATTLILTPQLLRGLLSVLNSSWPAISTLRFAAVGGAPLPATLLSEAHKAGLPVYEGYGLSECASVVSLNTPEYCKPGSVGRPLPHARLAFANDGEIEVSGSVMDAYLNHEIPWSDNHEGYVSTGDIGFLDDDGYLHVTGRKKNMYITAYGRNVAPEWIECELLLQAGISQACVVGEGRPWATAIVVPADNTDQATIQRAIDNTNNSLPEYARIGAWIMASEAFTPANQLLTGTGRPRRQSIENLYAEMINSRYTNDSINKEPA